MHTVMQSYGNSMDNNTFIKRFPGAYLQGSRFYAQRDDEYARLIRAAITEDTDYDYCMQYSQELYDKLFFNHFKPLSTYCDDNTECVLTKDNIQVSLRKDLALQLHIQNTISTEFYVRFIWT